MSVAEEARVENILKVVRLLAFEVVPESPRTGRYSPYPQGFRERASGGVEGVTVRVHVNPKL